MSARRSTPARSASRLALFLAAAVASFAASAQERTWNFSVFLDDAPIGHHRFTLRGADPAQTLTSSARFTVKVLGFTAYRYAHDATEHWRAACLERLSANTDDNGEALAVAAVTEGRRLTVRNARADASLDGCVMTFAYWNPAILRQQRLLNAQTGEHEAVSVRALGVETITVRGAQIPATRYRITGSKHPIDLWYSAQQEWLALESAVDGGRRLRYRLN